MFHLRHIKFRIFGLDRSSRPEVFCKKDFLEISQKSQENTCARSLRHATLLKNRPWHRCFPVTFVKYLKIPFFIKHLWWLLPHWVRMLSFSFVNFSYVHDVLISSWMFPKLLSNFSSVRKIPVILENCISC